MPNVAELSVASITPSALAVAFRAFGRPSWAVVPTGVIATELPLFVGMAVALRCFRRAAYEEDLQSRTARAGVDGSSDRTHISNLISQLLPTGAANSITAAAWNAESLDVYRGRTVLVTGAGGSIGSELSRRLCEFPVSRLLLLDIDETAIFELERDLESASIERQPIIGDIRNRDFLKHVFDRHRPDVVLHSAAYKHVPLMEANPSAAILNNVVGTQNVVDAAIEARCERFLLISTDKAVNPASVMGATKRITELLIQSRSSHYPDTRFACVRFGNVLGSRGSVVPVFLKQIRAGKPITLTDTRMTRYFMTVEQAARLVLLASTLGERGEIYVLKTGDPIEIRDLACRLAETSGVLHKSAVKLQLIGARQGEKLQEAPWEQHAKVIATRFPEIWELGPSEIPRGLDDAIAELERLALAAEEKNIIMKLQTMGIDYRPLSNSRVF